MKEIQEILEKITKFAPDEKAILATVIDVVGSGYRRPGARMLIDRNGYAIGTVSGGCLEADVLERAKKVLQTGEPTIITYDTTKDENSVFGLGMGCRGIVRILLETIDNKSDLFDYFSMSLKHRTSFKLTTIITPNRDELKIGTHIFRDQSNTSANSLWLDEMAEIENLPKPSAQVFDLSFGEVFVETIKPPVKFMLFGAGYDALPLAGFAKDLGWQVAVFDHRTAFANATRFPVADEIHVGSIEDFDDKLFDDENCVAVIMTHNYDRDCGILPRLLKFDFRYVGALGPKKRTEKIIAESGEDFTAEQLKNLYAPIGLDIGSETPEEIALAIIAEIQCVLKNRNGGFLRDKKGGIH